MLSAVTQLRLYDYNGNYRVAPQSDLAQSLRTVQNQFTAGFTVNGSGSEIDTERLLGQSLELNNNFQLRQAPPPSLQSLLSFGQESLRNQTNLNADSVTQPYQDYIGSLSITDTRFQQLLQQDSFTIFNGKVGLQVETDGNGNIAEVSLEPGSKDLRNGAPSDIRFPDRSQITERAISREANAVSAAELEEALFQPVFLQDAAQTRMDSSRLIQASQSRLEPIEQNPFKMPAIGPVHLEGSGNPLLQKLLRLQPLEVDTRVFGPDSQITPESARKLGAVQAALDVNFTDRFKENLLHLRNHLAQQANAGLAQRAAQARDGFIPVSPFLPSEPSRGSQGVWGGGFDSNLGQMKASADSTEKKSSGGYIPFRMGGDGQRGQDRHPHRRRPFQITA